MFQSQTKNIKTRGAKCTTYLIDQYIPEMWGKKPHEYLGYIGSFRYRMKRNFESRYCMAKLRQYEPAVLPTPYEVLVESHFRTLNACLVTGEEGPLSEVCTEVMIRGLVPLKQKFPSTALPLCRIIKLLEPPKLMQTRAFASPQNEQEVVGQLTYKLRTEQSVVGNKVLGNMLGVQALPFTERKTWFPYSPYWYGKTHYFYPLTNETESVLVPRLRISPLPIYTSNRRTFGSTGSVIRQEGNTIEVENYIVLEKPLSYQSAPWRIHHF